MNRSRFLGLVLLAPLLLLTSTADGGDPPKKKKGENIVGARWTYTATRGDQKLTGVFRVSNREVFRGSKKIGEIRVKDRDETTLIITGYKELNGEAKLRKTGTKPPIGRGKLVKADGTTWSLRCVMHDR